MLFGEFTNTLRRLEHTSSSTRMIAILADLLSRMSASEAKMAAYLLRGRVAPDFDRLEIGMADKFVIRALAVAGHRSVTSIESVFHKSGDLGDVAETVIRGRGTDVSLKDVFQQLESIVRCTGAGAQDRKINLLVDLLNRCSRHEARFVVRVVLGKLRLGVGEMIFLCGLSHALTGSKASKAVLEKAYNVVSDLGEVAERAIRLGIKSLAKVRPTVGKPIRMMLAQRVRDLAEVRSHIPGQLHVEYKYDGEPRTSPPA